MIFVEGFDVCRCSNFQLLKVVLLGLSESIGEDWFDDSLHGRIDGNEAGEHGYDISAVPPASRVPETAGCVVPFLKSTNGGFGL